MDLQAIHAAFASTLSANQAERHAAEEALKHLETSVGFLSALCHVVSTAEVAPDVRHAASIYFKNMVVKHWEHEQGVVEEGEEPPSVVFQEQEKASIRGAMLDAVANATAQTRPMMVESLRKICACDYPKKMGNFIQQVAIRIVPTSTPNQIYSGVLALRAVTKNFEYKKLEIRMQLNEIMAVTFPNLAQLMEATLNAPIGDEQAAEMQKAMVKAIWSCVQQSIPLYLQDPNLFAQWMSFLYRVIERPVSPTDTDSESISVFWKCRRWGAKVVQRIFSKYGNPKVCAKQMDGRQGKEGEIAISKVFHDHLASRFLQLFMQILSTKAQGAYLLERFVVECLNYIVTAVTLAETWKYLKPNVMPLICQVLFPMLCFDNKDAELWADDPTEFVRKSYDVMEDFESQRVASCNLIIDLCKKRTKTCLMPILEFCVKQMSDYQSGQGNPRAKDGAMYCIGSLANQLQEGTQGAYAQQLGWLLTTHVAPEFKSQHGHLRSRACWISAELVDTVSKDQAFFQSVMSAVIELLRDKELPVRFQAAVSLRMLIYDGEKGAPRPEVKDSVGLVLPQLLQEVFNLMDEVGSDELIATMDVLIESYADQMAPYAQGLCQRLSDHFLRLASLTGDEANEESSLAACQCCSAITTLLESIKKTPELYHSLEPSLVPLIWRVLTPDKDGDYQYMEFMEDALEILTYLTYYSPVISPAVWSLFKPLTTSFFDWAFDYMSNINMSMDNYISRGNAVFLSDPANIETIYKMIEKVMTMEESAERDVVEGCKLAESLVLNCKGRIDAVVAPLVGLVVKRFQGEVKKEFCRTELLKTMANCLYYNAEMAIAALEALGATSFIFQTWFTAILVSKEEEQSDGSKVMEKTHFRSIHDRKVCILGLSAILRVPAASLPGSMQAGLGHVVAAALTLLQDIETARRRKAEADAKGQEGEEDDDGAPAGIKDVDDDKDEEGDSEEDEDSIHAKLAKLRDGQGTWDDLFADDDDEDDEEYSSPIDEVDELIWFAESFNLLSTGSPGAVQQVTQAQLNDGQRGVLQHLLTQVPQRMAEIAARKQAEAVAAAGGAPAPS